ncbi:uncharacterized protein VTP21DRAFT_5687 [Calcarisporiella thermophila]|uniref:uncharacterized protein n=1 Tax=Calcarisporiella thermophila TaxID=911321 RepID=UPI003743C8F6
MALRLLNRSAVATQPLLSISARPAATAAVRTYSAATQGQQSEKAAVESEPRKKALSIIDSLPGNSLISKTGYLTLGTGLTTFAISKELYVFNEETLVLLCFGGLVYSIGKFLRQPYVEWADAHINRQREILTQAREDHKSAVQDRIEQVGQMKDVVDVTKGLFTISKETAQMEAEIFELKQRVAMAQEVKSVLDSWVRYESSVREREQKNLAKSVIEKVMAELQNPKLQDQILAQSIQDVERIVSSKSA